MRTVDQIIADLAIAAHELDHLAWMPEPERTPTGPHDCRPGGNCGLDLNAEELHAQWARARFRVTRTGKRA